MKILIVLILAIFLVSPSTAQRDGDSDKMPILTVAGYNKIVKSSETSELLNQALMLDALVASDIYERNILEGLSREEIKDKFDKITNDMEDSPELLLELSRFMDGEPSKIKRIFVMVHNIAVSILRDKDLSIDDALDRAVLFFNEKDRS